MQGWSVLCSGRFDRVMLLLLHREGATSGRQQKTTSPRACGPSEGEAGYPRVCGATSPSVHPAQSQGGLSPRVRGNPAIVAVAALVVGPIPACAGQPAARPVDNLQARAYPRVCGATFSKYAVMVSEQGLSPRVRGNRDSVIRGGLRSRPIPACAGQPESTSSTSAPSRAYPRVCGATGMPKELLALV